MRIGKYNPFKGQNLLNDIGTSTDRSFVAHFVLEDTEAVVGSNTAIKTAVTLADALTTTLTTADINQPTAARVLNITGNAATAIGDVVITGTDIADNVITETIVSTGAATVSGTKAFKTITTIVLPERGAPGDTIAIGTTNAFGLPYKLAFDTIIKVLNNGTATTVASGNYDATDISENFITPTAAPVGNQIDVYLLV